MWRAAFATLIAIMTTSVSTEALAWGGRGHRIVAAIAMLLIPEKAAQMNTILGQLERDNNFVDAASYPDEFIRGRLTHSIRGTSPTSRTAGRHSSAASAYSRRCRRISQ
jgi:hypothetical protein